MILPKVKAIKTAIEKLKEIVVHYNLSASTLNPALHEMLQLTEGVGMVFQRARAATRALTHRVRTLHGTLALAALGKYKARILEETAALRAARGMRGVSEGDARRDAAHGSDLKIA